MSARLALIASAAVLLASSAFAATTHNRSAKSDPILNHSGPISYAELQQIDQGKGYNSRAKATRKMHMQSTAAPAADAAPAAPADTAVNPVAPAAPEPAAPAAPATAATPATPDTATAPATPPAATPAPNS